MHTSVYVFIDDLKMAYNKFNAISSSRWVQEAIGNDWAECDFLDTMHQQAG